MYIRKTANRYRGKERTNYLLVESVRTEKGPRQKTVCSLGNLEPRPAAEWLAMAHRIEDALVGQGYLLADDSAAVERLVRRAKSACQRDHGRVTLAAPCQSVTDAGEVVAVRVNGVRTECFRAAGPVHVGVQFWKRLGMGAVLQDVGLSERAQRLTCAMTMNRLISPASEHAMPDWFNGAALADILGEDMFGVSDDALYRNLDVLHPQRQRLESALAERERTLFNLPSSLLLYDLTSTYFEGAAEANEKARRGYSRDKRPDCKQVVIGLVIGAEGFPLAHEVFPGNLRDSQSLGPMLDALHQRHRLAPGQTVVVDRGMAFDDNLAQIRSRGLHYVVASRQSERDDWLAEFEDLAGFEDVHREPSPQNPSQRKSRVRVKRCEGHDHTVVLCLSDGRQNKDRAIRQKHEQRLLTDIDKLSTRIANGRLTEPLKIAAAIGRLRERYPRVARYYRMDYDTQQRRLQVCRDEQRYELAAELDGAYILKTDRQDLSAEEAWRIYMALTRAESAFRAMKSPLAERPVFHQLTERVETHIFLCVLAYHLLVAIENTLRDRGEHTSWATVRDALASHQICTVLLPAENGDLLHIRQAGTPEPEHRRLYRLLNVPSEVIPQRRTWIRQPRQSSDDKRPF